MYKQPKIRADVKKEKVYAISQIKKIFHKGNLQQKFQLTILNRSRENHNVLIYGSILYFDA